MSTLTDHDRDELRAMVSTWPPMGDDTVQRLAAMLTGDNAPTLEQAPDAAMAA